MAETVYFDDFYGSGGPSYLKRRSAYIESILGDYRDFALERNVTPERYLHPQTFAEYINERRSKGFYPQLREADGAIKFNTKVDYANFHKEFYYRLNMENQRDPYSSYFDRKQAEEEAKKNPIKSKQSVKKTSVKKPTVKKDPELATKKDEHDTKPDTVKAKETVAKPKKPSVPQKGAKTVTGSKSKTGSVERATEKKAARVSSGPKDPELATKKDEHVTDKREHAPKETPTPKKKTVPRKAHPAREKITELARKQLGKKAPEETIKTAVNRDLHRIDARLQRVRKRIGARLPKTAEDLYKRLNEGGKGAVGRAIPQKLSRIEFETLLQRRRGLGKIQGVSYDAYSRDFDARAEARANARKKTSAHVKKLAEWKADEKAVSVSDLISGKWKRSKNPLFSKADRALFMSFKGSGKDAQGLKRLRHEYEKTLQRLHKKKLTGNTRLRANEKIERLQSKINAISFYLGKGKERHTIRKVSSYDSRGGKTYHRLKRFSYDFPDIREDRLSDQLDLHDEIRGKIRGAIAASKKKSKPSSRLEAFRKELENQGLIGYRVIDGKKKPVFTLGVKGKLREFFAKKIRDRFKKLRSSEYSESYREYLKNRRKNRRSLSLQRRREASLRVFKSKGVGGLTGGQRKLVRSQIGTFSSGVSRMFPRVTFKSLAPARPFGNVKLKKTDPSQKGSLYSLPNFRFIDHMNVVGRRDGYVVKGKSPLFYNNGDFQTPGNNVPLSDIALTSQISQFQYGRASSRKVGGVGFIVRIDGTEISNLANRFNKSVRRVLTTLKHASNRVAKIIMNAVYKYVPKDTGALYRSVRIEQDSGQALGFNTGVTLTWNTFYAGIVYNDPTKAHGAAYNAIHGAGLRGQYETYRWVDVALNSEPGLRQRIGEQYKLVIERELSRI